ncbi:MAG: 30S ribosome-binding factor RbfA [Candidatus Harrisonbacteria bacterium]|nr:30S ribosome-binding factor RbfA [Candidatus Harrisonbacteria bacterium]
MAYQRYQRVESLIREELNKLIIKELEFSGALVTVTGVEVQKDLDYAIVNVSVIPSGKGNEVLKNLEQNWKQLQHLLLRKINIRPMPEIRFRLDVGLEKAADIEKTFLEIEKDLDKL